MCRPSWPVLSAQLTCEPAIFWCNDGVRASSRELFRSSPRTTSFELSLLQTGAAAAQPAAAQPTAALSAARVVACAAKAADISEELLQDRG
jgi:hypothetical protein